MQRARTILSNWLSGFLLRKVAHLLRFDSISKKYPPLTHEAFSFLYRCTLLAPHHQATVMYSILTLSFGITLCTCTTLVSLRYRPYEYICMHMHKHQTLHEKCPTPLGKNLATRLTFEREFLLLAPANASKSAGSYASFV